MEVLKSVELLKKTYDKLLGDIAKENDLTLNEIKILMFLNNNNESNIAKDIVEGLKTTKSHVSMSLCDLEKKGYIEKKQDDKDKKKSYINLTKKSFRVIELGKEAQKNIKDIMLNGIDQKDINIINNVLKNIKENLENFNKS